MSTGNDIPAYIEDFHGMLMKAFHDYRNTKVKDLNNQTQVIMDGGDLNNIIASAKKELYKKRPMAEKAGLLLAELPCSAKHATQGKAEEQPEPRKFIKELYEALTNGIGEKPYYRKEDNQFNIYVADDQLFCVVPFVEGPEGDYAEFIAKAICEAGLLIDRLKAENERYEEAFRRLQNWTKAYPLEVFPKPDLKKAAKVLKANGMTLDSISADNMRHVLNGIKDIVEQALKK